MIKCPECQSPFTPTQIERLLGGKSVICEICGYEHSLRLQDFNDITPAQGMEPQNLFQPGDLFNPRIPSHNQRKPLQPKRFGSIPFQKPMQPRSYQQHPFFNGDNNLSNTNILSINEKKILKTLSFNWLSITELANEVGALDKKQFYLLRMKLNEMQKSGLIQIDNQVNKIMIRRIHSH